MKKVLAMLLTLGMLLTLSVAAFAAEATDKAVVTNGETAGSVTPKAFTLNKEYDVVGGEVAPNETVTFTVEQTEGVMNVPLTVGSAVMTEEDEDFIAPFQLTFAEYTKVGRYVYEITEVAPETKTLGVTYDDSIIYVVVTITNAAVNTADEAATEDLLVATVAVHRVTKDATTGELTDDNKIDPKPEDPEDGDSAFINTYDLGQLSISKAVTGNLASNTKAFTINVTFTNGSNLNVGNKISYTEAGEEKEAFLVNGSVTIPLSLKNGDSASFVNIPAGIKYEVKEADVHTSVEEGKTKETSEEGYTATYTLNGEKLDEGKWVKDVDILAKAEDTVDILNEKKTGVDTGIVLDSLPYVMIVAVAAAAVVTMIIRKRREVEG